MFEKVVVRMPIYCDYNATTPCAAEVLDGMSRFFATCFGNPASSHSMGREASRYVEVARKQVADAIGCDASEIVFTSGATESNNLAILGLVERSGGNHRRVLISAVEHKSILSIGHIVEQKGMSVTRIPVDHAGVVDIRAVEKALGPDVLFVSIQAANNEVGTVQPVGTVAELAHQHGIVVHCDAAQALGKISFNVRQLGADIVSLSSHKMYGPKGVGALFVRCGLLQSRLAPIFGGGGQEGGLRPGTLNVPGIVGFGIACELAGRCLEDEMHRVEAFRDQMEERLLALVPDMRVNGNLRGRLPGTSSITICGIPGDAIVANVSPLCISTGSACTSGAVEPSHVLLAMGVDREDADCTIRISLGRYTRQEDVDGGVVLLETAIRELRQGLLSR